MEVSQSHLVNLSVVELIQLVHFCRGVVLIADAQGAIHVRTCHFELVEQAFLGKFRQLYLQ